MRFAGFTLWILLINSITIVDSTFLGAGHKLRRAHKEITSADLLTKLAALEVRTDPGWGAEPGPVGEKPKALKKVEDFHYEWLHPIASLNNIVVATWTQVIVTAAVWMSLVVLAAVYYKNSSSYVPEAGFKPYDAGAVQEHFSEWQSSWYQCYRYPGIFAWACCCPCIRWAHTMDLLQFLDFWPAFFLFFLLEMLNQLTAFVFIGVFFTGLLVCYRQKFRKLFGLPHYGTCGGYTMDCLGLCFCWPCFIAQEAHHITQASKQGWTKDLAVKSGPFSARRPTEDPCNPALSRYAVTLQVPDNAAFGTPGTIHTSPSGSAFHTPRMTPLMTPR